MPFEPHDLASVEYTRVLRQAHEGTKWGGGGKSHSDSVIAFAKEIGAKTILDYGCGRGTLKLVVDCAEYDPGIPKKAALPEPADLVVSTDVLEHIEPPLVPNVLQHIRGLSLKGTFLVIAVSKAKFILPDGRNAHLSIHDPYWWLQELRAHGFNVIRYEKKKGLHVWCRPL